MLRRSRARRLCCPESSTARRPETLCRREDRARHLSMHSFRRGSEHRTTSVDIRMPTKRLRSRKARFRARATQFARPAEDFAGPERAPASLEIALTARDVGVAPARSPFTARRIRFSRAADCFAARRQCFGPVSTYSAGLRGRSAVHSNPVSNGPRMFRRVRSANARESVSMPRVETACEVSAHNGGSPCRMRIALWAWQRTDVWFVQ